jgi:hypothetical protein
VTNINDRNDTLDDLDRKKAHREYLDSVREQQIITDFLSGLLTRKPDFHRENEARVLLAQQLRYSSVLSPYIRWRLAALIDPDSFHYKRGLRVECPTSDWMLVIKPRPRQGETPTRLPEQGRNREIAWRIADLRRLGEKMEWIEGEIKREYGVGRRTMYTAWEKYKAEATKAVGKPVIKSTEWLLDASLHDR